MNWIKFAFWIGSIYAAYYLALILWDLVINRRLPTLTASNELTFIEEFEPQRPATEIVAPVSASAMISSGGVSLQQLYLLAREEAIEYTRAVSF